MLPRIFLMLLLFGPGVRGFAWYQLQDPVRPPLRFEHSTTSDGLSQSVVTCMIQDHWGFLWIGTQGGLNRFNGYEYQHFQHDPANPHSISENWVSCLLEDRDGQLWVGTQTGGVDRFVAARNEFEKIPILGEGETLTQPAVFSMIQDKEGVIWMGSERGLYTYDRSENRFRMVPAKTPTNIYCMAEVNNLLVLGTGQGLFIYKPSSRHCWNASEVFDEPGNLTRAEVLALHISRSGVMWIGAIDGLYHLYPNSNRLRYFGPGRDGSPGFTGGAVNALLEDRRGRLWIGTQRAGLYEYDPKHNRFLNHRHDPARPDSIGANRIETILEDQSGLLWFGLMGHGLSRWNPRRRYFNAFTHEPDNPNSMSAPQPIPLLEDHQQRLWIGTVGGGLDRYDFERNQWVHYHNDPDDPDSLAQDEIFSLYQDSSQVLWIGTQDRGLDCFDPVTERFRHYRNDPDDPQSLGHDKVRAIREISAGILWIATFGGGLDRMDVEAETFTHFENDPDEITSLSDNRVISLLADRKGRLWIGTISGGLNLLEDPTQPHRAAFRHFKQEPGNGESLSHNTITGLLEDTETQDRALWVATFGGGLNLLEWSGASYRAQRFGQRDGLPSSNLTGVVRAKDGMLWIGTQKGLCQMDPSSRRILKRYSREDGLLDHEFVPWSQWAGDSGRIYFGTPKGVLWFDPRQIVESTYVPPIVLTDLSTADPDFQLEQPLGDLEDLQLSYRNTLLSLELAALDYTRPQKNRYRYRVEGLVDRWVDLGTKRNLIFTNLKPGDYTLVVQGSNDENVWHTPGLKLHLQVAPPPWLTIWAYAFYVLLLLSVLWGYQRVQTRKLKQERRLTAKEREISERLRHLDRLKDEFLANTSHELRTPLNGIVGLTESLLDGAAGPLNRKLSHDLTMVVSAGKRLSGLVNDILDFAKLKNRSLQLDTQPIHFQEVAGLVLALSQPLGADKDLTLVNSVPDDLPPVMADRNRLQQIMYNLVGNAIKYTDSGKVMVSADVRGDRVEIHVKDTGMGIPETLQTAIFESFEQLDGSLERSRGGAGLGLAVTRQLVELHGGSIWVASTPGNGATFSFTLPLSDGTEVSEEPFRPETEVSPRIQPDFRPRVGKPAAQTTAPMPAQDGTQPRFHLLIVDDEPVNRQVLVNHLSPGPFELTEAASGPQAIRALANSGPFDLVLLDIMMPEMSGYEACRLMRKDYSILELPIIFLTARTRVSDLVTGFQAGGNDYLTKPISKEELLLRVQTHLQLRAISRESSKAESS
ncbi:hybrid sensor histidine kinase/response regulator [Sulfidibacter corallicola]|uniref:histidine kinase n=1 Tax=Sulfidibacter corallicola TaxID=2818388 RepID=A0A8A4TKB2_SULCO|nr:hybrid sensor histidine kinase/response regulator [Sulfidibacter corallicola]QTD49980.1 response regulator [Sulfidibacter corallicola]